MKDDDGKSNNNEFEQERIINVDDAKKMILSGNNFYDNYEKMLNLLKKDVYEDYDINLRRYCITYNVTYINDSLEKMLKKEWSGNYFNRFLI